MSHQSVLNASSSNAVQAPHLGRSTWLDYWALTKPEVNFLILIATFVGFYMPSASSGRFSFAALLEEDALSTDWWDISDRLHPVWIR